MTTLDGRSRGALARVCSIAGLSALAACAAPEASTQEEVLGEKVSQPIVNGSSASAYTEAALVNGPGFICSGAVIAPRVVLTAGHCVAGASSWNVTAPYAGGQSAHGSKSWTQYASSGEYVNPNTVDVAVIVLDSAITMSSYPALASAAAAAGTKAVNVGRIRNGQASYSGLFVGSPVTLQAGSSYGFPYAYITSEVIESGDSGGPVYTGSGSGRTIVAVNSGAGGGTQVLARVDLVYSQIQQIIAQNGGGGSSSGGSSSGGSSSGGSSSGGSSSGGSSSGGSSSGGSSSGGSPGACTPEAEPNDASNQANDLGAARCGDLSTGGDIDWYTWDVGSAGVAYDVALDAESDADILMWKWTGSAWARIQSSSPTEIAATSSGPGTYVLAVRSASGTPQSYRLTLSK